MRCSPRETGVGFDVFDSAGRTLPPLLTAVHASRERMLEGNRRSARWSNWGALALVAAAPFLLWFDWAKHDGVLVLPTVIAINCLVFAVRLLSPLNGAYASAVRSRRERFAQQIDRDGAAPR